MRLLARAAFAIALGWASVAQAQQQPATTTNRVLVDRAVVRFYSPETGGAAQPRFITERTLAFEARLEALAERADGAAAQQERYVRAALEHHVVEEMLAKLPLERAPDAQELAQIFSWLGEALIDHAGGRDKLLAAARAEGVDDAEVDTILRRQVLAAVYIDHAITPVLHPSDEQLREVYRTSAHPFRNRRYEQARESLERWFVVERIRVAESAFLQSARTRVKIVVIPR